MLVCPLLHSGMQSNGNGHFISLDVLPTKLGYDDNELCPFKIKMSLKRNGDGDNLVTLKQRLAALLLWAIATSIATTHPEVDDVERERELAELQAHISYLQSARPAKKQKTSL